MSAKHQSKKSCVQIENECGGGPLMKKFKKVEPVRYYLEMNKSDPDEVYFYEIVVEGCDVSITQGIRDGDVTITRKSFNDSETDALDYVNSLINAKKSEEYICISMPMPMPMPMPDQAEIQQQDQQEGKMKETLNKTSDAFAALSQEDFDVLDSVVATNLAEDVGKENIEEMIVDPKSKPMSTNIIEQHDSTSVLQTTEKMNEEWKDFSDCPRDIVSTKVEVCAQDDALPVEETTEQLNPQEQQQTTPHVVIEDQPDYNVKDFD